MKKDSKQRQAPEMAGGFAPTIIPSAALVLALALAPATRAAQGEEQLPALQRRVITPEQVPAELQRARRGVLVRLPRAAFEDKVKAASRAGSTGGAVP